MHAVSGGSDARYRSGSRFAGLGLQLTLVTPSTGIATGFAALLALRIAQPIRLGIQQRVQCLLHATPDNAVQVILYPLIVNRDDIA
jgi:hypothetical protein